MALAPANAILYILRGARSGFAFGLAVLFAWAFKAANMEPYTATWMRAAAIDIAGQPVDSPRPTLFGQRSGAFEPNHAWDTRHQRGSG
jgi:hypothetical protein